MAKRLTLVIAPNEDGFGTSAWVVRFVKELVRQRPNGISKIKVVTATKKRHGFHQGKYPNVQQVELIRLSEGANRIELVKEAGSVDIEKSIDRAILTYPESRTKYELELARHNVLEDADLVVDLGVPQIVRATYSENITKKRASGSTRRGIIGLTIFDHAWSFSLRKIVTSDSSGNALTGQVEDSLIDIANDEALTPHAILFGEPICPLDYHGYWRKLLGAFPKLIPGTIGGPISTLEYLGDTHSDEFRSQLENNGQCPEKAYEMARRYARELLGIHNSLPTLFVSGAGTTVWDEVLEGLIDDYESNAPNYNVVVYSPAEVERRGIKMRQTKHIVIGTLPANDRIAFIDHVTGDTHHVLFPAFDLVLTRAGGGTVNDALACGVPLVLVKEPGMWQVESIRQSCLRMKVAQGVSLADFRYYPRDCIESQNGNLKKLADQRRSIRAIPNHKESWIANMLLNMMTT